MNITLPSNGWKPRAYQRPAWDYLETGGRHAELVWHRRSGACPPVRKCRGRKKGKDELCLHRTSVAAFERVGNYWHMLPKANQARKALWEAINPHSGKRRIDEAFPKEIRQSQNDQEMLIRFKNGSTWQIVGSDNFDSLVGSPPVGLVFSEWALSEQSSWAYLRPIIAENDGWVVFNTTPRGKNHAYRTFRAAQKEPGAFAQLLPADKTGVFTADELESERRQLMDEYGEEYGLAIYDQEYGCSFEAANLGAILGRSLVRAEREGRISNDVTVDFNGANVDISSDIGFRDTAAWWFWQRRPDGFALLGYIGASGMDAEDWSGSLKAYLTQHRWQLGTIWLPQDARARTFRSKRSSVEIFLDTFGAEHVDIIPSVRIADRINAARRIMPLCHFNEAETELGRDGLSAWSFEYNEDTKTFSRDPKHDWASHPGDAFSYGATVMQEHVPKKTDNVIPLRQVFVGANTATLEELWEQAPKRSNRI